MARDTYILLFNPLTIVIYMILLMFLVKYLRKVRDIFGVLIFKIRFRNIAYYRDEIENVLLYYGLVESLFGLKVNYLGYILLQFVKRKWLNYERVGVDKYIYVIEKKPKFNNEVEKELYYIVLGAAGNDYKLMPNELTEYLRQKINLYRLGSIESMIKEESYQFLWDKNIVLHNELNNTIKNFYYSCSFYSFSFNKKIPDDVKKLYGLYRFIIDFTLLREKGIEVESYWDILFSYAIFFGLSDKIKKMINQESVDNMYKNVISDIVFTSVNLTNTELKDLSREIKKKYNKQISIEQKLFEKKFGK